MKIADILLVTTKRNGNEIRLYKTTYFGFKASYYIMWGPIGNANTKSDIRTKSGRKPSMKTVMKQFNEAVNAMQYIKFL